MLKRVATTLVIAAIVGGTAWAGDAKLGGVARQISMGGASSLGIAANPFIFDDPVYQYINPAYQGMYKDYAWGNIGGSALASSSSTSDGYGLQNGGANFSMGDGLTLGTILSYDPSLANTVIGSIAGTNSGQLASPVEVLEVVGSYGFGHTTIGLGVMYGWTSADSKPTGGVTNELTGSVIGFRGGIYHDIGSGNKIEGAIAFRSSTADDKGDFATPGTMTSADASGTEFLVSARYHGRINNKVNFIIPGLFFSGSGDGTNAGMSLGEVTATGFALGAGADITVGDFYMAGGVSFASQTTELKPAGGGTSSKVTDTAFPTINIGGEYRFTDWLTGRMGYYRAFVNEKDEFPSAVAGGTDETNMFFGTSGVSVGSYSDDNLIVLGLAGNFGMVGLEATVSESALRNFFGLIGSTTLDTFGYITMNVNFE